MRYALNPYLKHVGWLCPECGYQNEPDEAVCLSEICTDLREDEERERPHILCKKTGKPIATKLCGGWCVCKDKCLVFPNEEERERVLPEISRASHYS